LSVRNPVVRARGSTVMTAIGSMIAAGLLLTPTGDAAEAGLQAVTSVADPTVGPLFENGLATGHSCTASVLNAGRDLLLTAAHCVTGTGAGVQFAPGYDGTSGDPTPYGVWTVTGTYVPTRWLQDQDADHDYAILQVADLDVDGRAESINEMTGGERHPAVPTVDRARHGPGVQRGRQRCSDQVRHFSHGRSTGSGLHLRGLLERHQRRAMVAGQRRSGSPGGGRHHRWSLPGRMLGFGVLFPEVRRGCLRPVAQSDAESSAG